MSTTSSSSTASSAEQPSLRDTPAETLLLLLPDRSAYPEGWDVAVADLVKDAEPSSGNAEQPLPACADPVRVLEHSRKLKSLVLSKGYPADTYQKSYHDERDTPEVLAFEGKLPEIAVSYFRESDGVDVINAYRDWAKRCPQGNAGTSDVHEKVTIIDGPDTKPDPSVTIRITTDHPPLDKTAPATTTILSVTRVRGVAVIAEIQNSDDLSLLAPVLQSALGKLRTA